MFGALQLGDKARAEREAIRTSFEGAISEAFESVLHLYVAEEEKELMAHLDMLLREEAQHGWLPTEDEVDAKTLPSANKVRVCSCMRVVACVCCCCWVCLCDSLHGMGYGCVRLCSKAFTVHTVSEALTLCTTERRGGSLRSGTCCCFISLGDINHVPEVPAQRRPNLGENIITSDIPGIDGCFTAES